MDDSQGGSIILIDPTTSGIIGTLTPASPSPETEGKSDDQVAHPTPQESGPTEGGDEILTPTPQRRDPTYSYRLSISDLSLRTFAGASADAEQSSQYPPASVMGTPSGATRTDAKLKDRKSQLRSSWMTDDASFWTARGTLRLDGPVEAGEEREREVVVAYVKTDTSLNDLFPPYVPNRHTDTPTHPTQSSRLTTISTATDSPFPSRILHLFPRLSTLPRGGAGAGTGLPGGMTQGLHWPDMRDMDPATVMAGVSSHAEAAFWRLVMPGISGLYGWTGALGQAYEHISSYLPIPNLSTSSGQNPLRIEFAGSDPSVSSSRLYSEETIYTLRLPESENKVDADHVDIGPTVRPVWVKKRAALPVFVEKDDGWGREGILYHR